MSGRTKRRRLNADMDGTLAGGAAMCDDAAYVSSISDKGLWNGFCEIESEPALFNVMLREFGVEGIKVQEVVSLDEGMMALLPRPVYGLIFLFRWHEDDPQKQEASCPDGLWFANQTISNACASVALLNIVNNVHGIVLGDNLKQFKDFTLPFTPALRGEAISHFEFLKRIHNSFARTTDMLNSDLQLKNEATLKRSSGATRQYDDGSSEAGFHFIAFVPVMGSVWKFDGLERQPQSLGPYSGEDWLKLVRPHLEARMRDYEEDQIEFSVLSVVKDPLCAFVEDLALNVKRLRVIGECLQKFSNNDSLTSQNGGCADDIILGPSPAFQLTQDDIDLASDSDTSGQHTRDYQTYDLEKLTREDASLRADQRALKVSIQDELQSRQADDDYANGRRYDYTSVVSSWARILARKGIVRDFIDKSS